jgi:hypothetical protein
MIDLKELRVGNLVEQMWIAPPYVISEVSVSMLLSLEEYKTDIRPIPLTPEWLNKLGFHSDIFFEGDRPVYALNKSAINFYVDFDNLQPIQDGFPIAEIKIKHVHQLQNLFFALTGTELTLKQPETI